MIGQVIGLARFGRLPAVHAYIAKLWGIFLFAAICGVLGFGSVGVVFDAMLIVGFIAYAEWLAILLLSREAAVDVASVISVLRQRKSALPFGSRLTVDASMNRV